MFATKQFSIVVVVLLQMFCLVDLDILTDFTFCHLLDLSSWQELRVCFFIYDVYPLSNMSLLCVEIKEDNNRLYLLPCFSLEDGQLSVLLEVWDLIDVCCHVHVYCSRLETIQRTVVCCIFANRKNYATHFGE